MNSNMVVQWLGLLPHSKKGQGWVEPFCVDMFSPCVSKLEKKIEIIIFPQAN